MTARRPTELDELLARQAIERLKYTYVRAVDENDWETLRSCLTEDATATYGEHAALDGRDAIVDFIRNSTAARPETRSVHRVTQPVIELDGTGRAVGTWVLSDTLVHHAEGDLVEGVGDYHDRYRNTPDGWRIEHTGYERRYVLRGKL